MGQRVEGRSAVEEGEECDDGRDGDEEEEGQ